MVVKIKDKYDKSSKNVLLIKSGPWKATWIGSHERIDVEKRGEFGMQAIWSNYDGSIKLYTHTFRDTKIALALLEKAVKKVRKY